jgi:prepilin-type N-terminal cleavage/methylation domain-containing protein/prepilin-type processing-associated H-X9-DG protein
MIDDRGSGCHSEPAWIDSFIVNLFRHCTGITMNFNLGVEFGVRGHSRGTGTLVEPLRKGDFPPGVFRTGIGLRAYGLGHLSLGINTADQRGPFWGMISSPEVALNAPRELQQRPRSGMMAMKSIAYRWSAPAVVTGAVSRRHHNAVTQCGARGFTLIELLVVISVIAVLAGMLIPAVGMVREMAHGTSCRSLMRQYGMANMLYAGDNEGAYVPSVQNDASGTAYMKWYSNRDFIEYLDRSPAGTTIFSNKSSIDKPLWCPKTRAIQISVSEVYGMNRTNGLNYTSPNIEITCRTTQVNTPSESMMMADSLNFFLSYTYSPLYVAYENELQASQSNVVATRHRGSANVVFFDGHVEAVTGSWVSRQTNISPFWKPVK